MYVCQIDSFYDGASNKKIDNEHNQSGRTANKWLVCGVQPCREDSYIWRGDEGLACTHNRDDVGSGVISETNLVEIDLILYKILPFF